MKDLSCISESTTEEAFQRPRYLELSIFGASNLEAISDFSDYLQPYIRISQHEKEWETSVSLSSDSSYNWNELFELYIDLSDPFTISILDKDDFGSDTLLGGFSVSPEVFLAQTQNMRRLNLSILPIIDLDDAPFPSAKKQITQNTDGAALSIGIRLVDLDATATYSVKINSHKNIIGKEEFFTVYEVSVFRNDGAMWNVLLRFSQVQEFRNTAIKENRMIKQIEFPKKTYFDWICCRRFSKFNEDVISKRKIELELFLNTLLANQDSRQNLDLRALLKIP